MIRTSKRSSSSSFRVPYVGILCKTQQAKRQERNHFRGMQHAWCEEEDGDNKDGERLLQEGVS